MRIPDALDASGLGPERRALEDDHIAGVQLAGDFSFEAFGPRSSGGAKLERASALGSGAGAKIGILGHELRSCTFLVTSAISFPNESS